MLSIACLLFPISPVSSFVALSSVSSVQYPLPISVLPPFTQKWFNVQLKLWKAINTRCVMNPAELKMELLILLSLFSLLFFFFPLYAPLYLPFPYCSLFLFLWHNISESNPFWTPTLLSSVCCGCCAVAPTKIEIKKEKNKLNFPKLGKREHNKLTKWIAPDFSRQKALTWREKKEDEKTNNNKSPVIR